MRTAVKFVLFFALYGSPSLAFLVDRKSHRQSLTSFLSRTTTTGSQARSSLLQLQASNSSWVSDADSVGPKPTSTSLSSSASSTLTTSPEVDPSATPPPILWGQPLSKDTKEWNHDIVHTLKGFLFDKLFAGDSVKRAYARFYALETIARMPYFSYLSVLHLFETLGWWRRADYLKVHFAESWNEMHHLLIMEELGGNDRWADRFVAQHIAFGYYWIIVALYLYNPTHAYHLNQMVEEEAYGTYDKFITENREFLSKKPAPESAVKYYTGEDLFLFDAMHHEVSSPDGPVEPERRRPKCDTLLDCFTNIRDDEEEHVKTMTYFQRSE